MKNELISMFQKTFSGEPQVVVKAPGRINVVGEHVDYHLGFVLPAAIDQAIYLAISAQSEGPTKFYSVDHDDWYVEGAKDNPGWSGYIRTVIDIAKEQDLHITALHCAIAADLPVGAGLSSSAALCCGLIFGLDEMFGWNLDLVEMAEFGQAVEHRLGIHCGLMDEYAVLHGRKDHVIKLDCGSNTHSYVSAQFDSYELVLLHSGVSHALVESAYNDRRRVSEAGLQRIREQFPQVKSYRDVKPDMVARTHTLSEEQVRLAQYIISEIGRVQEASLCLDGGDFDRLGQLLLETHRGLQTQYLVTCQETDFLVDALVEYDEVLGARQMGGGFGGCILILVEKEARDRIIQQVQQDYRAKTKLQSRLIPVILGDGVCLV